MLRTISTLCAWAIAVHASAADPLPSWNDGPTKQAIVDFVTRVTTEGGPDYVPPVERIATFDNDGTLWSEQPYYFQFAFALDRVKTLAARDPALADEQPFKAVLDGDTALLVSMGQKALVKLISVTHAGMTEAEFRKIVVEWTKTARHPRFNRPYTELVYQPMLELMAYLRASGFKTFIVSGGGQDFMRAWVEPAYGVPLDQVVGSEAKLRFELRGERAELFRLPEVDFIDDGPGKPIGIERFVGRRPIAAFGNSDGDLQMLEYTTMAEGPRFGLIVHHTDAVREWAYDRDSKIGRLDKALNEAPTRGWVVVDMKNDWKVIYPFEKK